MRTYIDVVAELLQETEFMGNSLHEKAAIQYAKEALDVQLDYLINAGYIKEEDIAKTKSGYFQYLKDTLK